MEQIKIYNTYKDFIAYTTSEDYLIKVDWIKNYLMNWWYVIIKEPHF